MRWLTRCRVYMKASVTANMVMSGQKLLYKMPTVSLRRPQAVKGASLRIHTLPHFRSMICC